MLAAAKICAVGFCFVAAVKFWVVICYGSLVPFTVDILFCLFLF